MCKILRLHHPHTDTSAPTQPPPHVLSSGLKVTHLQTCLLCFGCASIETWSKPASQSALSSTSRKGYYAHPVVVQWRQSFWVNTWLVVDLIYYVLVWWIVMKTSNLYKYGTVTYNLILTEVLYSDDCLFSVLWHLFCSGQHISKTLQVSSETLEEGTLAGVKYLVA